jgi:hypothetical protein
MGDKKNLQVKDMFFEQKPRSNTMHTVDGRF